MFTIDASKIRALMFEQNISGVVELGRKAQINGLTASRVVKDGSTVTTKTIAALARLFGVNGEELILKG